MRKSIVKEIKILSASLSSIAQFGDTHSIKPFSKAIAVQREIPSFLGNEGIFTDYPLFSLPIPSLDVYPDKLSMSKKNKGASIKVHHVEIFGVAASSVFQVSSNKFIESEARVKQFRQLLTGKYPRKE